jgi:MFS family permease
MDQPFLLTILVVLIGFCLAAFFITLEALFGELVEGITRSAEEKPGKAFWVGLVNMAFLAAIGIGLVGLAENSVFGIVLAVPGFLVGIFVAVGIVFGLAGMVRLIAGLVFPGKEGWKLQASGSGLVILACLVPYIGWFGLFPYLGLRGFGAFILYLMELYRAKRMRNQEESPA